MIATSTPRIFLCNGATLPSSSGSDADVTVLNYLPTEPNPLVCLRLPKFVDQVDHLPNRILDLLELAAYVFAADRASTRGPKEAVEYHPWARSMHFVVKVRDANFWNQSCVKARLSAALCFMTGDLEYSFDFVGGHSTPPAGLFDKEDFVVPARMPASVVLFSGGLDSLAGALERLETTKEDLYLISHRSGQPSTKKTQAQLVRALREAYPGRIHHYSFDCGLANKRGAEETQRTRAFLFGSIAFALSHRLKLDSFFAYENGVTSLNFLRRQDLMNARASRTTHPQTHGLMAEFLSELHGRPIKVANPFWTKTKADVFAVLNKVTLGRNLISSAVSCSKTFQRLGNATHCGCCFQCIDRRIAAYAVGLQDLDNAGIYSSDIFRSRIETPETKTTALDYVRQAMDFSKTTDDAFALDRLSELADVTPYVGLPEEDAVEAVWGLCHRHGEQVVSALSVVRQQFDDLRFPLANGSLLELLASRAHLSKETGEGATVKGSTLEALQADVRDIKIATIHLPDAMAKVDSDLETVKKHVRGVPLLQADLRAAQVAPAAVALEIQNRIADILTMEEQEIWRAVRNADGVQKKALPSLMKSDLVKSAATLSRRVAEIDKKLAKHGLPPCNASGPAARYSKSGGYVNDKGKTVPAEVSAVDQDWAKDEVSRDTTIKAFLAAGPDDQAYFRQTNPGIEDEAKKYLKRRPVKSD